MIELPDASIGAIAAAIVAGIISLLGLIISKEQKVSEFRQAWIDSLRNEISSLISHATTIHDGKQVGGMSSSDTWSNLQSDFRGINEATAKIRLRLNPEEPHSAAVLGRVEELEKLLAPYAAHDYQKLDELGKNLTKDARAVLKLEWKRVRSGERTFRIAKWAAIILSLASIVALLVSLT